MTQPIHHTHCPVCQSTAIHFALRVKDHTVSGESFDIFSCEDCSLRFTQDAPNQAEIGTYYKAEDYISHTNTSKGLINRLYQIVRKRTLAAKRKLVTRQTGKEIGKILDYGSGTGSFASEMKQRGWTVTGLEPDADARRRSHELYGLELLPLEALHRLEESSYDAITLWHVLEHVHDLNITVQRLKSLLRIDGKLFIAVPNYTSYEAGKYGEYWAAYDVPRHLYHFSPQSMERLAAEHGLVINSIKPMWYDSFYISLLSSRYRSGRANWPGAAWNGMQSNLHAWRKTRKCSSVIYVISKS